MIQTRRDFLKFTTTVAAGISLPGCVGNFDRDNPKAPLNFLFVLVDDMGFKDLSCFGSDFYETPNIDRLASGGMKFTNAYAASPVCSPTRASIHSGKYPARMGINFILNDGLVSPTYKLKPPHCETEMKLSEVTFAEVLRDNGYKTFFAGKWHLGEEEKYYPEHQGFDVNIGGHSGGQPASYFYPYKSDNYDGQFDVPGLEAGKPDEYLTDRLTDEMIKFMDKNKDSRFLAFLSLYSVHTPIEGKPELVEKYKKKAIDMGIADEAGFIKENKSCDDYRTPVFESFSKTKIIQNNAIYAAMVQSVDENVGKLMGQLERSGIDGNTVIIFFSDNGGFSTHTSKPIEKMPTSNLSLRAGKGWLYEGGIREPMIISWPGVSKPGSLCDEPVTSVDFYPTIMEMAEIEDARQTLDGVSLVPLLKGKKELTRDAIYWHMPHYHSSGVSPCSAVRWGNYKLIEYFEDGRLELYDLANDISEKNDISQKNQELTNKLKKKLADWRISINAAMPKAN